MQENRESIPLLTPGRPLAGPSEISPDLPRDPCEIILETLRRSFRDLFEIAVDIAILHRVLAGHHIRNLQSASKAYLEES